MLPARQAFRYKSSLRCGLFTSILHAGFPVMLILVAEFFRFCYKIAVDLKIVKADFPATEVWELSPIISFGLF